MTAPKHEHEWALGGVHDDIGTYRCVVVGCDATTQIDQRTPPPRESNPELESEVKVQAVDRAQRTNDLVWRDSVYEGMFAHLPVAEGELWAHNVSATALRSIPGFAELFDKSVPDEYVAVDLNEEGYSEARVACPCGETHQIEVGTIKVADCGRAFYWFGHDVRRASLEPGSPD